MTETLNNVDTIQEHRLVELTEMERNNSETTDDSPFTSALTTPVDQDVPINVYQGIHEALARDMDGSAVDSYFDLKAVGKGADIAQVSQQLEERRVVEVEIAPDPVLELVATLVPEALQTTLAPDTSLSSETTSPLVLEDITSRASSPPPLYQEPGAMLGDSNERTAWNPPQWI